MDTDNTRSVAEIGGAAYIAGQAVGSLYSAASVMLSEEDFGPALVEELRQMQGRIAEIEADLGIVSRRSELHAPDFDAVERYRLAHRGQEPPLPGADAEQLDAIEERKAA